MNITDQELADPAAYARADVHSASAAAASALPATNCTVPDPYSTFVLVQEKLLTFNGGPIYVSYCPWVANGR